MLFVTLDTKVSPLSSVRLIDAFVDKLDLTHIAAKLLQLLNFGLGYSFLRACIP